MESHEIIINGQTVEYVLITLKAGTPQRLNEILVSKFGQDSIDALNGTSTKIKIDDLIEKAKSDKEFAKELTKNVENRVNKTIVSKLSAIYKPAANATNDNDKGPIIPISYASWHDLKYSFMTIAMEKKLWGAFNSKTDKLKRALIGLKANSKEIGKMLSGTMPATALGAQAAINWLGNKLQYKSDTTKQRKKWRQEQKPSKPVNKFANALDKIGVNQPAANGKNQAKPAADALPAYSRWTSDWEGRPNELEKQLKTDFGDDIVDNAKNGNKNKANVKMELMKTEPSKKTAISKLETIQKTTDAYFVVIPYETENNRISYIASADDKTKKWLDSHPINESCAIPAKYLLSYNDFKKMILESL